MFNHTAADLERLEKRVKELEQQIVNQAARNGAEKKIVWDYLQKASPWSESNDMLWVDEVICGIDGLVQDKDDAWRRFKEAADLLACVSQQVGNAAPDDRRHCLTPEVRDGITAILKGLRPAVPRPVTQDWVQGLKMMQQTVLLTAIRGPDGLPKYGNIKYLLRWLRRCVLLSSIDQRVLLTPWEAGGGSFTGPSVERPEQGPGATVKLSAEYLDQCAWEKMDELADGYLRDLDAIPHHFQLHFMHAVEILGYKHPDPAICDWWHTLYRRLVHDMHLHVEEEEEMDRRLGDSRDGWLARADRATAE